MMYFSGIAWLSSLSGTKKARILTYHRVNKDAGDFLSIDTDDFERQMAYLSQNYNVVSLSDIAAYFESGRQLPDYSVAITFDDGYKDNFTDAFPVLRKYRLPAAIFLVHDYIGTGNIFEWDEIDSDHRDTDVTVMGWSEIKEMAEAGIEFGAHTMSHPILSRIMPEQARREIRESKKQLEQRLGAITLFAYPRGEREDFNGEIMRMVKEAGFSCAVTTVSGTNDRNSDRFALRRTAVEKDNSSEFMFRLLMMGVSDIILSLFRHSVLARGLRKIAGKNIYSEREN